MPIIHVNLIEGRPKEKVTKLIENLSRTASETLDAPIESVRVLVTEIPGTYWGVAGEPMSKEE